MTINLITRDYTYWNGILSRAENYINIISKEFERGVKWKEEIPLVQLKIDWSENFEGPKITRIDNCCYIILRLGFIKWLDDFVIEMQEHLGSNNGFCLNNGDNDISEWVLYTWLSWFIEHELGHLFCGHYVGKTQEWYDWKEIDFKSLNNNIRLSFEYDADMFASEKFFSGLAYAMKQSNKLQGFGDKYFSDMGFICFVLFSLLERIDPDPQSHPKLSDRLSMFMLRGFKVYEIELNKNVQKELRAFALGIYQAVQSIGEEGQEFFNKMMQFNSEKFVSSCKCLIEKKYHLRRMYNMKHDWVKDIKNMFIKPEKFTQNKI